MATTAKNLKPNIVHDLRTAMPGEAKSWLEYQAYADQAASNGHHDLAKVYRVISHVERFDHFYHEAEIKGYTQASVEEDLHTSIDLAQHLHTMFSQWEQNARSANDSQAADYFQRVAQHTKGSQGLFQQALSALKGNHSMPQGPDAHFVKIQPQKASSQGKVHEDLKEALKQTAFSWETHWMFARHAVSTGHPDLAVLFLDIARVEREELFNHAANLYGLVGTDIENLKTSITDETHAHDQYSHDHQQAQNDGNSRAASFFKDAASEEDCHKHCFEVFLHRLQG